MDKTSLGVKNTGLGVRKNSLGLENSDPGVEKSGQELSRIRKKLTIHNRIYLSKINNSKMIKIN